MSKRASLQSYHKSSKSKMGKTSHSREVSAKSNSQQKVVKYVPSQSLTRTQLKALQYLLSGVSYLSVLESSKTNKAKMRDRCGKAFHGFDTDHLGVVSNFLMGRGRFEVLWDDDRISSGYGDLSGLRRETIDHSIRNATLRGNHALSGRQILEKAELALCEAKKFLAYWMEFLVNGSLPSGMTEENALKHVMKRALEESSCELEDGNESIGAYLSLTSSELFMIVHDMYFDLIFFLTYVS